MKKLSLNLLVLIGLSSPLFMQAQETDSLLSKYPNKMGHLLFSENYMNFNYLKDTEDRTDTIRLFNSWDQPMEVSPEKPPKYMNCILQPPVIPAGQEGLLIVTYYGTAKPDYGFIRYRMGLRTNDTEQMIKTLTVNAYIEEDFSTLTEEERSNPPKLEVVEDRFNFGTVTEGTAVTHDFVIRNTGQRELIIRSTKASCGCTATKPEKTILAPGEESRVGIVLDTKGRKGMQHKTVSLITNDPRYSSAMLHIEGTVE